LLGSDRQALVRASREGAGKQPRSASEGSYGAGLTLAGLVAGLAAAVADELEARRLVEPPERPALLDRRKLGQALGIGVDVVDRLRREGCPEITVGDAPRFDLERVLIWLRERGEK
jgi:hypothetical protein